MRIEISKAKQAPPRAQGWDVVAKVSSLEEKQCVYRILLHEVLLFRS